MLLFFARLKWVAYAIPGDSDYGEDIEVIAFVGGVRTHMYFRCQVKTAGQDSTYVKRLKNGDYSVKVRTSTLQAWVACYYPVIIVVYDEVDETLHWADGTQEVRGRSALVTQKTMNVTVPQTHTLSEDEILDFTQLYYSALIHADEPVLSCGLIISLMPACRSVSIDLLHNLILGSRDPGSGLEIWFERQDADLMPVWATALFSGSRQGVLVLKVEAVGNKLTEFMSHVRGALQKHLPWLPTHAWFSCAWSPIKLHSKRNDGREDSVWAKDLTHWFSESLLRGNWIDDAAYSFKIPPGFEPQTAAKATGWRMFHSVDSVADLALNMCASVFTHAADKVSAQNRVQEIERLYYPWQCPRTQLNRNAWSRDHRNRAT